MRKLNFSFNLVFSKKKKKKETANDIHTRDVIKIRILFLIPKQRPDNLRYVNEYIEF